MIKNKQIYVDFLFVCLYSGVVEKSESTLMNSELPFHDNFAKFVLNTV